MSELKEARKLLREKLLRVAREKGHGSETCPCCFYSHTVRKFTISWHCSWILAIAAMKHGTKETFNYAVIDAKYIVGRNAKNRTGGDFVKMCHFGLVRKLKRGVFQVTKKGVRWLRGEIEVPERVIVIGKHPVSYEGKPVTIVDVVGRDFKPRV